MTINIIFWLSLLVIFYSYIGYGILLWMILKVKKVFKKQSKENITEELEPHVTLIVASYNESEILKDKIKNCYELDYPSEKCQFYFIADVSNDSSTDIIAPNTGIKLFY